MSVNGFRPIAIPNFGGWNTLQDPDSVIVGMSPDLRNVEFVPGEVRTRPGLTVFLTSGGAAASVNGIVSSRFGGTILSFFSPDTVSDTVNRELSRLTDQSGFITLPGPQAFISPSDVALFMNGLYVFDRAYLAFQMDEGGLPRGALPALQYTLLGTPSPSRWDLYTIEGPYSTGLSGQLLATANAGAGSIVAGIHNVMVIFETRNGFLPAIHQPGHSGWLAAGAQLVDINDIPIGPPGTIKRHLAFTAAGGKAFHKLRTINNNTTTSQLAIDFTDSALLALENMDFLFRQVEVYDPLGITQYGSRMVVWGGRDAFNGTMIGNSQEGLNNLGFDGGFNGTVPAGWSAIAAAGGSKESTDVVGAGEAYKITGDGATAIRGHIRLPASSSSVFPKGQQFNVKAWVKRSVGLTQGTLKMFVQGGANAGLAVTAAQSSVNYQQFSGVLWDETEIPGPGFSIELRVEGTPTNAQFFLVDRIHIYDARKEYETDVYRLSDPDDPEAFDGIDGLLVVNPDDQQEARAAFVIRNFLYLVKEHGLYVTADTGEVPARWPITEVSDTVGTPSVRGVGIGDEWAVIGHQSGLWYFDGGELTESHKLTKEIQPTWDSINWTFGHRLEIKVDTRRKRIYVAAPFDGATVNNRILVLDYVEGFGDPMLQKGFGRKWCPWFISCNSMEMAEQAGGKKELVVGNNANNGAAFRLDSTTLSDGGVIIVSNYQTAYLGNSIRNIFGYLHLGATGAGTLDLRTFRGNQGDLRDLRGWTLDENGFRDLERQMNTVRERVSFRFGVDALNEHFSVRRLTAYVRPAPWSPVRGTSR